MGSWRPSRVCSEPFRAGLPQWKWSWRARYLPGRPPPLMVMCSEADSLARVSITARAAGQGEGGLGWGTALAQLLLPQLHPSTTINVQHPAAPGQSQVPVRMVTRELGQGRVPSLSTHLCARCLSASTCQGEPGHNPRRGCPRGHHPAAAGACRCSQGTACRHRMWLSAPSSGWALQRRSRGTTGSH